MNKENQVVTDFDREMYHRYPTLNISKCGWEENPKKYELTTLLSKSALKMTTGESIRINLQLLKLIHLNLRWHNAPTSTTRKRIEPDIRNQEEKIVRFMQKASKRSLKSKNWKRIPIR